MSPSNFHRHDQQHAKSNNANGNSNNNNNNNNNNNGNGNGNGNGLCPPPLKINKESHMIKKSSSSFSSETSSSTSSASSNGVAGPAKPPQQQRHPVIIYTHAPKVIHTHPRDFMALVQKLTGLSRSEEDHNNDQTPSPSHQVKQEKRNAAAATEEEACRNGKVIVGGGGGGGGGGSSSDDNDSSSVITDDQNCGGSIGDGGQVNSCFVQAPPLFEPSMNYVPNLPAVFQSNSADLLCPNQPLYNYTDSFFYNTATANARSSISSSSALEGLNMNDFRDF